MPRTTDCGQTPAPSTVNDPPAYTRPEFAAAHRISLQFLHKLRRLGLGPKTKDVGSRTLVTGEDAAAWRRSGDITILKTGRRGRPRVAP